MMVPRKESGWVSRFGHLEGIKGIQPSTHLEVIPFAMTKSTFEPESPTNPDGRDLFSAMGTDLRYGIRSNFSLNATLNPDFGQVEADPEVLNLSVFETFFEERRPFFVEGAKIFETPIQLLYSRRIGRRPGRFPIPDDSNTVERPEFTTILGAAKLTGKRSGGAGAKRPLVSWKLSPQQNTRRLKNHSSIRQPGWSGRNVRNTELSR